MSINQSWINWRKVIIDDRRLSFGAKGMALYLNTYMNDSHDMAWPSISTICGELGIGSYTTAIKYLSELEKFGYIQKEKRFGNNTHYHAILPKTLMESLSQKNALQANEINSITESVVLQNMEPQYYRNCNHSITESVIHNKQGNKQNLKEKEKEKEKPLSTSLTVNEIFQHWQNVMNHPKAILDNKRKRIIQNALKSGFSVEDLKTAVDGCSVTPHNMGENDRHEKYDGLHVILDNADQIERFMGNTKNRLTQTSNNQCDVEGGCL